MYHVNLILILKLDRKIKIYLRQAFQFFADLNYKIQRIDMEKEARVKLYSK